MNGLFMEAGTMRNLLLFLSIVVLSLAAAGCGGKNPETYPERRTRGTGERILGTAGATAAGILVGGGLFGAAKFNSDRMEAAFPDIEEARSVDKIAPCKHIDSFTIQTADSPDRNRPHIRPIEAWYRLREKTAALGGNTALMASEWTEEGIGRKRIEKEPIPGSQNSRPEGENPEQVSYVNMVNGAAYKCPDKKVQVLQ